MPSRARNTIKEFAHAFFVRVNYIDIYGRNVGYDYNYILTKLKEKFPGAKTSRRWLQMMAYELNGSVRFPVRRRSRTILARDYAKTLLLKPEGLPYGCIVDRVYRKFPEHVPGLVELGKMEMQLRRQKFPVPER